MSQFDFEVPVLPVDVNEDEIVLHDTVEGATYPILKTTDRGVLVYGTTDIAQFGKVVKSYDATGWAVFEIVPNERLQVMRAWDAYEHQIETEAPDFFPNKSEFSDPEVYASVNHLFAA